MSRRSVPAPFLTKTYQLVDDPNTDDVISWNEAGTTFVVWRSADFSKDLLPNYFKHSNFSSFVRQLNTYGFRKNVPDKWEFANANFKRGHQELLPKIRRRKTSRAHSAVVGELATVGQTSPSNSGDDMGSTSTSFKNTGPVEVITPAVFSDLSDENEKLRKDNEALSTELTETKTKCDELVAFLTQFVRVDPDQISRIMEQRTSGLGSDGSDTGDDGDDENETEDCLKLFGVYLKGKNKKRGRDEGRDCLALTI